MLASSGSARDAKLAAVTPARMSRLVSRIGVVPWTSARYLLLYIDGNVKDDGMPEHRDGTPEALADLESFLWWDFDPALWAAWAEKRGFDARAARGGYADAMELQMALRRLESANNGMPPDASAARRINQAIELQSLRPHLSPSGDLQFALADLGDPTGFIVRAVVEAMIGGIWRRFKLCRDPACQASYFDASKNNAKTWCSMETCGSRNKMRRLRARRS